MSADSYNTCPACYSRASGVPISEIRQVAHLNEADVFKVDEGSLREFYEIYINEGQLVLEYHGANCPECGYSIPEFTVTHPIPTETP